MSKIEVNAIEPQSGTTLTLGASGDTVALAAGASQSGFGRTGTVNWDTTPKTTTVTAVSGVGYFVNTTSGAITVNLPAGTAGDIVAISDYANTATTNNITITPNGSQKIQGLNSSYSIITNGGTVTLVYVDATQGWRPTDAATSNSITAPPLFTAATGGCVTTCGNYKIHTFTGPGSFVVTQVGNSSSNPTGGPANVDYLVVAGGAGGGGYGGGGAGGFRESVPSPAAWTASPLASPGGALPVSVTAYPITVGSGGTATPSGSNLNGGSGNNSVFSTITSTGGGYGRGPATPAPATPSGGPGGPGGSGGGGGYGCAPCGVGGTGNTPPVSPSQGNNGGGGSALGPTNYAGGGGGGASAVGTNSTPGGAGSGGDGVTTSITGSPVTRAGGGGGGSYPAVPAGGRNGGSGGGGNGGRFPGGPTAGNGTANTGSGGGGSGEWLTSGSGGSGIVVIRYKFQ
jgi:hypothetical protein